MAECIHIQPLPPSLLVACRGLHFKLETYLGDSGGGATLRDPFTRNSTETQRSGHALTAILLSFYPAYARGQEKAVTVAAKSGHFTVGETRKGQFLRGNRRNLAEGCEIGIGTHLFVKVPRPGDSEVTFSVFESRCHLLLPV